MMSKIETGVNRNQTKTIHKICLFLLIIFMIFYSVLLIQEISIENPRRMILTYHLSIFSLNGFLLSIVFIKFIFMPKFKRRIKNEKFNLTSERDRFYKILIRRQIKNKNNSKDLIFNINCPRLCPICGSSEIAGVLKIKNIYSKLSIFTKINVCLEHLKLKKKENLSTKDWIYSINVLLSLIIFSTIAIITKIQFFLIFAFTLPIIFGILFIIPLVQNQIKNKKIKKFITFEVFSEGSIISVKNEDWLNTFKKNNQSEEISEFYSEKLHFLDRLLIIYHRMQRNSVEIAFIGLIFGLIPLLFLSNYISYAYLSLISAISLMFFVFFIILAIFIKYYIENNKLYNFKSEVFFAK